MLETVLDMVNSRGTPIAVRRPGGLAAISRGRLTDDVCGAAAELATVPLNSGSEPGSGAGSVWVCLRDRYLMLVNALGCLHSRRAALVDADGVAAGYDALAAACPPALVLCDQANAEVVRWARAHAVPTRILSPADRPAGHRGPLPRMAGRPDPALQFFTSGTTGAPKCVSVGAGQLVSAIEGVAGLLALGPGDTSLSIAPLTHTLGLITTVLVALTSGGTVAFADPQQPREFVDALGAAGPTWCAASPSAHTFVLRLLERAGLPWPELRVLRASAGPLTDELAGRLEDRYAVPVLNAYVLTEAPGEVASQPIAGERPAGTVGRPTLCEVEIRTDGVSVDAGTSGEVWIRGPNVVPAGPVTPAGAAGSSPSALEWFGTRDLGTLDRAGYLRITGRVDDVINTGGLKVWPADVEAVAGRDPSVAVAVAFPVPHAGLGQSVGLAVVPTAGREVDGTALRRRLLAGLPRHACPSAVVVCAQIPVTARGKIQRRELWRLLPGIRPRVDGG